MPDGPGGFAQDSSCPALLRIPLRRLALRVRGSHPLRPAFPGRSARARRPASRSYYPGPASRPARFGLFPVRSPLLGESLLFSLPGGTKMFQFPPFASRAKARDTATRAVGCPIRRSAGQGPFAPNRGFSQLITSFVASVSQGIRHAPFITFLSSTRAKARGGGSYFQL